MSQAPPTPTSTSADSITCSTNDIRPTYYLRDVYLTVVCSCGVALEMDPLTSDMGGQGFGKHTGGSISCTKMIVKWDLTKRLSLSKYLEELHKHQKREKKREYVDFCSAEFWAEEDDKSSGTAIPHDLQLMAIVAGGPSRDRLYGVGSEAALPSSRDAL
ncbi:hypothetical protein M9H77_24091 [Catharanthus roseus]|uniref:Uncharacterized protein n=1 Tax=Catharanthus roseus TaxID=4058 RepID=A0ACC0AUV4_CATRO|nr:hypothetical protein M9H77_24091 [Catharanthus roseus]